MVGTAVGEPAATVGENVGGFGGTKTMEGPIVGATEGATEIVGNAVGANCGGFVGGVTGVLME